MDIEQRIAEAMEEARHLGFTYAGVVKDDKGRAELFFTRHKDEDARYMQCHRWYYRQTIELEAHDDDGLGHVKIRSGSNAKTLHAAISDTLEFVKLAADSFARTRCQPGVSVERELHSKRVHSSADR